ncbi:preprotein translocase subunit SecG [Serpentinicella sp. ANB-PHB4]|uniref:preprotein translocase subunit SecG n=1 Tax=Serpentinicella sp. ANB-PHB4 TaxID=3074076 RepID=UPI00285F9CA3|nr:preprotein translocase subunit SecG [Serpentinicella sp. ANB-PHB4]MDR5658968.1 preprotein translocase subunit SecG [Serpentinicella sp. ANB-PHB4]
MLRNVLMVIQLIVSVILIATVLLQTGKSAGLTGSIGGGAEQTWSGKNKGYEGMLSKLTVVAAVLFVIVAIALVTIQ